MKTCHEDVIDALALVDGDVSDHESRITTLEGTGSGVIPYTGLMRISADNNAYISPGSFRNIFYQDGTNGTDGVTQIITDEANIFTCDNDMSTGVSYLTTPDSGHIQLYGQWLMDNLSGDTAVQNLRTIIVAQYNTPSLIGAGLTLITYKLRSAFDQTVSSGSIFTIRTGLLLIGSDIASNTPYSIYVKSGASGNVQYNMNSYLGYYYLE